MLSIQALRAAEPKKNQVNPRRGGGRLSLVAKNTQEKAKGMSDNGILSLPKELREVAWAEVPVAALSMARGCCKQMHVEIESMLEKEAARRYCAAMAIEGALQRRPGERDSSWWCRQADRLMQPHPGESARGWAVRTLHNVAGSDREMYLRINLVPTGVIMRFTTYKDETCGSLRSRLLVSAKLLSCAEVEDWRFFFHSRPLADTCKLSAYEGLLWGDMTVYAVPSNKRRRARTVVRYSS